MFLQEATKLSKVKIIPLVHWRIFYMNGTVHKKLHNQPNPFSFRQLLDVIYGLLDYKFLYGTN